MSGLRHLQELAAGENMESGDCLRPPRVHLPLGVRDWR